MTTKRKRDIDWTPIAIAGAATGGIYLVWKIMQTVGEGSAADRELAREIMAEWYVQFEHMQDYTEMIYYMGKTPTDQELAILSAQLENMGIKELTVYNLSTSVWQEMKELFEAVAEHWWLFPAVGLGWVPGYATYKLVKKWKDKNRPPPNFPCPRCDHVAGTEGALKNHFENTHEVIAAGALEAQVDFHKLSNWVQGAVAIESVYGSVYNNWGTMSMPALRSVTWGLVNTWVYNVASLAQASILWNMVFILAPGF